MKAFTFIEPGKGKVSEKSEGNPGLDEVLVKVAACGICGTDMRIWRALEPATRNISLGHEFAGEVVRLGAGVKEYQVGGPRGRGPEYLLSHLRVLFERPGQFV